MSAPRRPVDDARLRIEDAARSLAELRRALGAPEPAPYAVAAEAPESPALRAALDQARRALEDRSRELVERTEALEAVKARASELERQNAQLAARPPAADPALEERARRAEEEAGRARQEAAAQTAGLAGRVSLLQAEIVRLEALRGKAEERVKDGERGRGGVEEALRRELRQAHAAVDRAAAEAGAREARATDEAAAFQSRLDAALTRIEQIERERRVERGRTSAERERLAIALQRAAAAHAALRRELALARGEAFVERAPAPGEAGPRPVLPSVETPRPDPAP